MNLHIEKSRKELSSIRRKNYYNDMIIALHDNTLDISRVEKARWFRILKNKKLISSLSNESWGRFRHLKEKGFKGIVGERKDRGWYIIELSDYNGGVSISTKIFDFDKEYKLTNFIDIDHDLINKYFHNEKRIEFLNGKNCAINQYLFGCIKEKYYKPLRHYNGFNYVNHLVITLNDRLYVFENKMEFKPIILPEDENFNYLKF